MTLPGAKNADGDYITPFPLGFVEDKESGEENYDVEQGTINATRIFLGPWENRLDFIKTYLLSIPTATEDGDTIHLPPNTYPIASGAIATRVHVKGFSTTDNQLDAGKFKDRTFIKHELVRLTVGYKVPAGIDGANYAENTEEVFDRDHFYIEERIDTTTEIVEFRASDFVDNAGNVVDIGGTKVINKTITLVHIQISMPILLNPDWNRYILGLGHINWGFGDGGVSNVIFPSGIKFGTATLLYDGINGITKYEMGDQKIGWSFTLNFTFRALPWWYELIIDKVTAKLKQVFLKPELYGFMKNMNVLLDPTLPFDAEKDLNDEDLTAIVKNVKA